MSDDQLTPAMRQYMEMKARYPGAVIFFQMGDFYEMFFEDAEKAAPLLDIALTRRARKGEEPIAMCGVPVAAGLSYANRLTEAGYRVVVANQVGDPSKIKGLLPRAVWQVGTPGLPLTIEGQNQNEPHYLAAVRPGAGRQGLAALEVSTGELLLGSFEDRENLRSELAALHPRECLLPENPPPELLEILAQQRIYPTFRPAAEMEEAAGLKELETIFGPHAPAAWELPQWPEAAGAAGAVLNYARECGQGEFRHLAPPRLLWNQPHLVLDEAALANLEILKTLRHGEMSGSLLGLMDKTVTALGGRLLRQWLAKPLRDPAAISARHGAVEELLRHGLARDSLTALLKQAGDMERALSRTLLGRGGPRDLALLRNTLDLLPELRALLARLNSARLARLGGQLPEFEPLAGVLRSSLADNPPFNIKDGGAIRRGVSAELDELLDMEKGGKSGIAALEVRERQRTGINSLKVGFNRIFGYYLEVTKANLTLVPEDWIRKQTIAGGERYLTPELKRWEEKIAGASEKRLALEEGMFEELCRLVSTWAAPIKEAAATLAELDVLAAFAAGAERHGWIRPELTEEDVIDITGGRHPVVEALMPPGQSFVANDVRLSPRERILVITGPNMAGKSTVLRQTALIILMNQAGSFVPAASARLSIRDRIFTRVGAADDLARGRSTFMVEMSETARILSLATPQSLVVLDEVGRGTSTYDGLALAWAIAEHLHDLDDRGAPTLFATHYHELVKLAETKARVRNFNVSVKKTGGGITFMRELKPGGVSRSYGLVVAALAGLPPKVLDRAKEVLADLSEGRDYVVRPAVRQLSLFDEPPAAPEEPAEPPPLLRRLAGLNPDELTPLAALNLLSEIHREARQFLAGADEGRER
ncbi:MAG: DNA mismatch repair protein MutS [Candidatus Adiutrix sp.]|jgi:DNA mismatch repair protein MutS|nr:DNA mismatch repair protein MutS [Candidatus Adiutrix sp.]